MVQHYDTSSVQESRVTLRIYETLYHLKKYPSLKYALQRFVEENPQSELVPTTRIRIAQMLFNGKEYYQSLALLDRVIEDYTNGSVVNKAFVEKARVYQAIGNRQEVKTVFRQLLSRKDAARYHSYAAHELSSIYFDEAEYDSALYLYNLLLDDEDYREKAIFEIAKIYDVLGQNEESDMMIDKLISEFPASVFLFDAYILKARTHKSQGYYSKAIKILNDLIKKVGQKPEIYVEIGDAYFEMEDYLHARENYLTACSHFKQKRDEAAQTLLLAGDASIAIGDKDAARQYYLQAHLIAESVTLKDQAAAKINTISEE
jgi:tetratricopeptide (TPR) repeat protein